MTKKKCRECKKKKFSVKRRAVVSYHPYAKDGYFLVPLCKRCWKKRTAR